MLFEILFDKEAETERVVLTGRVEIEDVLEAIDALTADGVFVSRKRLWDIRACELVLTASDLREIAAVGKSRDIPNSRGALLVSSNVNFGLSRMHEVFRQTDGHAVHVFRDESEALAWLAE